MFCRRRDVAVFNQQVRMMKVGEGNFKLHFRIHWKKLLQNLISSAFGSQLYSSRVFRAKYMLDTEHQGVASEIRNFSGVITNARAQADF